MSAIAARGVPAASRAPLALWAVILAVLIVGIYATVKEAAGPPTPTATSAAASASSTFDELARLQRSATIGGGSTELSVILATPAYLRATGQTALTSRYAADRDVVLIVAEDIHYGDLPAALRPDLLVDGETFAPARVDVLTEAPHHRVTALVYSDPARPLAVPQVGTLDLRVAGAEGSLEWHRPYGAGAGSLQGGLTWPLILALMGGMLASMWPCLFQLTAYFLPSVAGLSMDQARDGRADRVVLRTAILFVSGIVVVYTLAGLAAGFAAQSVSGTALFQAARQPLTFIAGLAIIGMAARLALRARRPLVCHMPTASPTRRGGLGTVALGLAFATGCMTCFGAAIVLGMFTYVVTTASPFVGAAILFLFSLGIAVPLVLAAMAMARVLPLLGRLERVTPALTLVSAAIMAGYGVLLITGTSHVMSDAVARLASAAAR